MDINFSDERVRRTVRLVHELSRDLKILQSVGYPSVESMTEAPLLEDWAIGFQLQPALVGTVLGHPLVADGPVTTSGLYYVDSEMKFARTLSRYYRLGKRKT